MNAAPQGSPEQQPHAPPTPRAAGAERGVLIAALMALAATYAVWFQGDAFPILALVVFALPPLALAIGVAAGRRTAGFWAGVLALFWFSHAVMLAWSEPAGRGYALLAAALAIAVVFASSMRGLAARFSRGKPPAHPAADPPAGPRPSAPDA